MGCARRLCCCRQAPDPRDCSGKVAAPRVPRRLLGLLEFLQLRSCPSSRLLPRGPRGFVIPRSRSYFELAHRSKTIVERLAAPPARKPRASAALVRRGGNRRADLPSRRQLHYFANDSAGLPSCFFCRNIGDVGRRQGAALRDQQDCKRVRWSRQPVAATWRRRRQGTVRSTQKQRPVLLSAARLLVRRLVGPFLRVLHTVPAQDSLRRCFNARSAPPLRGRDKPRDAVAALWLVCRKPVAPADRGSPVVVVIYIHGCQRLCSHWCTIVLADRPE